jgi:hypothetical protein
MNPRAIGLAKNAGNRFCINFGTALQFGSVWRFESKRERDKATAGVSRQMAPNRKLF